MCPTGRAPLRFDDQGYLVDPSDWSDALAVELAREEGIVLTEAHWVVIRYLREQFDASQTAPDARHVMRHLAAYTGRGEAGRNDLFTLFPYGYVKQACRIAGMRKPRAWSTG